MKSLIVYSSLTGNTKMVAEAISKVLMPCDIASVEENPSTEGYDLVAVGYWVDKGGPDAKAKKYLDTVKNSNVAIFATLGAEPDSPHGIESLENGIKCLDSSNKLIGKFICQGKIDPKVIEMMRKMFGGQNGFHAVDEKRQARHKAAASHPNEEDLKNAQEEFIKIKNLLSNY